MVKEPSDLSVQLWLVAQVTRFGFVSSKDTLSTVRASKFCTSGVIEHIIMKHAVSPSAEDLIIPCRNRILREIELYVRHMTQEQIRRLIIVIPNIIRLIISYRDDYVFDPDCLGFKSTIEFYKENIVEHLVSNGLAITVNDLKFALARKSMKIIKHLLKHMDGSFGDQIRREIPDIFIQILRINETGTALSVEEVKSVADNIVNKLNINVNYVNGTKDSAIQCVMDIVCRRLQHDEDAMKLFDLIANLKDFDIDQRVKNKHSAHSGNFFRNFDLRPIDLALKKNRFDMVIKLLMAGADCRGIQYYSFERDLSAVKLLKLLYHLGIYVNIAHSDLIYDWFRRQPLKSLQELAAMAVRRNCTRKRT